MTLLAVLFGFVLGAEVQCPPPSEARPSLADLQAQIDALTARVQALENPTRRNVFVTSQTFQGNLGGLGGADAICDQAAGAAGLSGTYRAWLGDTIVGGPNQRFQRAGPYSLVDGTVIASTWDGLTDATLLAPIRTDEFGKQVENSFVWAGVRAEGNVFGDPEVRDTCFNWTTATSEDEGGGRGRVGLNARTDSLWSDYSAFTCDSAFHLYCFEQ